MISFTINGNIIKLKSKNKEIDGKYIYYLKGRIIREDNNSGKFVNFIKMCFVGNNYEEDY